MRRVETEDDWCLFSPVDSNMLQNASAADFFDHYTAMEDNTALNRIHISALACWTAAINLQNKSDHVSFIYRDNVSSE